MYIVIAFAVVVVLASAIIYAHHEARDLRVRRMTVEFDDLPAAFDGYTIAFASDFHVRRIGPHERNVLACFDQLRADLLVLGGDLQSLRHKPAYATKQFIDAVAAKAGSFTDGVVVVRGNHDSYNLRSFLLLHPVVRSVAQAPYVIRREDQKIAIAGVRRSPRKGRRSIDRRIQDIAGSIPDDVHFRILASHWPDYFRSAWRAGFNLVLSGDTHGGQIRLPIVGPVVRKTKLPRRCAWGLTRKGNTALYVTNGVGTRLIPLRFLCRPEIAVLELRCGDAQPASSA